MYFCFPVFISTSIRRDKGIDVYEYSRMDAMVAERLTASPRVFDIYGFCGLSIVSEFFEHGDIEPLAVPNQGSLTDEEKQQLKEGPLHVFNDISPSEKLRMSLQMAEGIADIHGNAGGVIVHQDVQLSQFLFNSDKSILKLNDFNRAGKQLESKINSEMMIFDKIGLRIGLTQSLPSLSPPHFDVFL